MQVLAGGRIFPELCPLVQSKLFPKYFLLQTAGSAIALATLYYSGTGVLRPQLYALGGKNEAFEKL